jgi:hypothetical protein
MELNLKLNHVDTQFPFAIRSREGVDTDVGNGQRLLVF